MEIIPSIIPRAYGAHPDQEIRGRDTQSRRFPSGSTREGSEALQGTWQVVGSVSSIGAEYPQSLTCPKSLSDTLSLEIAYGLGIDSPDHPILHCADEAVNAVKRGLTPGKWVVDILPFRE